MGCIYLKCLLFYKEILSVLVAVGQKNHGATYVEQEGKYKTRNSPDTFQTLWPRWRE